MKGIKLTKGKVALVDHEDYEYLSQWKWYFNGGYAVRGCPKRILMHRLIAKTPDGFDTDHINRNKLDNRKANLRVVSRSQNLLNVNPRKDNKSGYVGIFWNSKNKNWRSTISFAGRRFEVGSFSSLYQAVCARKEAERRYV